MNCIDLESSVPGVLQQPLTFVDGSTCTNVSKHMVGREISLSQRTGYLTLYSVCVGGLISRQHN